jgi:hypothetical protein
MPVGIISAGFTRGVVMLTVLWLVLAALVIARMTLYFRDRIPTQDNDLDRQIYRLNHVVATAREMDAYREIRAMAQRAKL